MIFKPRLILIALLLSAGTAHAERINIAAIVNDEIITTTDLAERRDLLLATNNMAPTLENQQRVTPRVLQSLIDEAVQMQEAKRLSINVTKEEIEAAMRQLEESRRMPAGSLRDMLKQQHLSARSLEAQLSAQLAWNKVVQRKLRREVSISQDEIARAQAAAASDPGIPQLRIAAISILAPDPKLEEQQAALARDLSQQIRSGTPMAALFAKLAGRDDVRLSPPAWIDEEKLQPAMQQALRGLQPGDVSPPLKSLNSFQLVQLMERRTAKRVPDSTEVVIKEIVMSVPPKPDKKTILALRDRVEAVAKNPGDCMSEAIGVPGSDAKVKFSRLNFGVLPPEVKPIIADLEVTEISPPMMGESTVRLFMVCERIDPALGNLPPAAEVRRQLFNEKIELEAQKHLRNLKRDAFIEIKGAPKGDNA